MTVSVILNDMQSVTVDHVRIEMVATKTADAEGAAGELSITLVESDRMAELNKTYMDSDGPTDVLSFPVDGLVHEPSDGIADVPVLIGEVVLCPQVVEDMDLVVAHGVLHLFGYDHDTPEHAEQMRAKEHRIVGRSGAQA
ncbi:MAG: rRNA maturation RNase YbeY [Actinomycetota bacterium]